MPTRVTKQVPKRYRSGSLQQKLVQTRRRCPKVSRSRLRTVRDELENTQTVLNETLRMYWFTPEHDVRSRLAHTEKLIGRTVKVLAKAA